MAERVIVVGSDPEGVTDALSAVDVEVVTVESGTREAFEALSLMDDDTLLVTDIAEATAIPVALELADVRTIVYASDTVPEFVRGQLDLAVDPRLVSPDSFVDAIVD